MSRVRLVARRLHALVELSAPRSLSARPTLSQSSRVLHPSYSGRLYLLLYVSLQPPLCAGDRALTTRRRRMIADLPRRGLSARTQAMEVRAVRQLAEHDHKSPDRITEEALRAYVLALKHVTHDSRRASPIARCGLTCVYTHTWRRAWTTLTFLRPPREQKLPVILSPAAVRTRLACVRLPRYRVCLSTIYACGLRLQEGTPLQGSALDAARRRRHVRQGQGAKDRDVPLPPRLLARLRQSWGTPRHPGWICPAPGRGGTGLATASTPMPRSSRQDAFRAALQERGSHKRAGVHTRRHSWATPLLEAGLTRPLIQAYLGQQSPSTTALYTHLTRPAQELAGVAINRLMEDRCWSSSRRSSACTAPRIGPTAQTRCGPAMGRPCRPSNPIGQQRLAVTSRAGNTAKTPSLARTPAHTAMVPHA